MTYIALLVVALVGVVIFWFKSPDTFSGLQKYVSQTKETLTASDSSLLKPVNVTYDVARKADLYAIQGVLLQYRIENGKYPETLDEMVPDYLAEVRTDPKTKKPYGYSALSNGESYELCIDFETSKSNNNSCIRPD
jgi:hypothetical protein